MRVDEKEEVTQRLLVAGGHLKATIAMLDAGEPCEMVLRQLGLVQAALGVAATKLLVCQIKQCQEVIRHSTIAEDRVAELASFLVLYYLLTKNSKYIGRYQND